MWMNIAFFCLILVSLSSAWIVPGKRLSRQGGDLTIGFCNFVRNRVCPDKDIKYVIYCQKSYHIPEVVEIDAETSNLEATCFDPSLPVKIIIHGYNSNMFIGVLVEIKNQYLIRSNVNVIAIDWSPLAAGPCYPAAVWNLRFVGQCVAHLIDRLREHDITDIHVIGFSLGAHVAANTAEYIKPYKLPRITGLDPALPGFLTVSRDHKLDANDAEFVDVVHTNAFIQGQVEQSGHVDFYMNGGIVQPGCWAEPRFFACNHHRAPLYFAESINTEKGFWAWECPSYFHYLLNGCLPREPQILMGENVSRNATGVYLVITGSVTPYALGKYTGPSIEILKLQSSLKLLSRYNLT